MKVVGLITEYNPFHNGHKYHIQEAKRLTGADYVIAVMSGNFVQRGVPAVIDKYSRTGMALQNGVDLVFELPVCYATGSAEYFAHGAVSLLDKLGVVDMLCFGSECGEISPLSEAADYLLHAPASYHGKLQALTKEGLTYPAARQKALQESLQASDAELSGEVSAILAEPNNILGIEYIKALHSLSSSITPVTMKRISAHYHDIRLNTQAASDSIDGETALNHRTDLEGFDSVISSATAIRNAISHDNSSAKDGLSDAFRSVPEDVAEFLQTNYQRTYPITGEDFSAILKYKLLSEDASSLAAYQDITSDLADRLKNLGDLNQSIDALALGIKTKNMTLTRINRALLHLLLNIKADSLKEYIRQDYILYARLLGIRKESSALLRCIEKEGRIPVITKVSKAARQLSETGLQMLSEDIFASHIYNQAVFNKYHTSMVNEYQHGICISLTKP